MSDTAAQSAGPTALAPMHPGELLREVALPAIGKTQGEIAALLGVTRVNLSRLLHEHADLSPEMALRVGKLCGNGPTLWMNLQRNWDLAKARAAIGDQVDAIPTLSEADPV